MRAPTAAPGFGLRFGCIVLSGGIFPKLPFLEGDAPKPGRPEHAERGGHIGCTCWQQKEAKLIRPEWCCEVRSSCKFYSQEMH